jgi:ankyrin repeat protein
MQEMSKKMDLRETKDPKGLNALHFAANKGSLEICKFLVEEAGLDVNSTSGVGK